MRSCLVEVRYIRIEDALELSIMKDQQMVEAFLPHTPQEALTDGIGSPGPDLCGVVAQKGRPRLASWLVGANVPHVLLDGALAHPKAQFQQFPTNPFSTPQSIILRHLPDQGNRFGGDLGLVSLSL